MMRFLASPDCEVSSLASPQASARVPEAGMAVVCDICVIDGCFDACSIVLMRHFANATVRSCSSVLTTFKYLTVESWIIALKIRDWIADLAGPSTP